MPSPELQASRRWLLNAASLVVVIAGLRAAAPFLLPLLLALFIALLSFPLVGFLCRRGVRLTLAVVTTVLVEVGLLLVVGFLIAPTLNAFVAASPGYLEQLKERVQEGLIALQGRGIDLTETFGFDKLDPGQLVDMAGGVVRSTLTGVASAVSFSILVLFLLIFFLIEGGRIPRKAIAAFGLDSRALKYLTGVVREVQHYLGVKTLISVATGILLGLFTWALGLPYAPVFGLVAFLLNFVPAIGSIIAAVPTVIVALLLFGPGRALIVAVGYVLVNVLIGNVIEPSLMGRRFGLSTLVVFISLVFWGWVWGPLGMLLSVPLTMMIKIALDESEDLQWVSVLMGRVRALPSEVADDSENDQAPAR
jgi:predicted PurR-regulated permease PerM